MSGSKLIFVNLILLFCASTLLMCLLLLPVPVQLEVHSLDGDVTVTKLTSTVNVGQFMHEMKRDDGEKAAHMLTEAADDQPVSAGMILPVRQAVARTAKIAGSSGKVTYTYYRNKACTKKTTVQKSGAKKKGGAPKYPGTYYVKVTVKKDSYFKGATANLVTLTIQPKVSFQWKEYQGYDFILPKISGLKWVKSYYVELYDKQNQLLRKSKKYTEPMKFGIRPGSGTKETDKYQAGKKYFVKVVFRMKNGGTITVAGRTMTR